VTAILSVNVEQARKPSQAVQNGCRGVRRIGMEGTETQGKRRYRANLEKQNNMKRKASGSVIRRGVGAN